MQEDFTAQLKAQIYLFCKRVATTCADIKEIVHLVTKGQHGIGEKIKQKMNLAESGKDSLERLEGYECVKSIFYSEHDDKDSASSKDYDNDSGESSSGEDETLTVIRRCYPLHIAVVSYLFWFFCLCLQFSNAYFRL